MGERSSICPTHPVSAYNSPSRYPRTLALPPNSNCSKFSKGSLAHCPAMLPYKVKLSGNTWVRDNCGRTAKNSVVASVVFGD